jgi:hypothetical protein
MGHATSSLVTIVCPGPGSGKDLQSFVVHMWLRWLHNNVAAYDEVKGVHQVEVAAKLGVLRGSLLATYRDHPQGPSAASPPIVGDPMTCTDLMISSVMNCPRPPHNIQRSAHPVPACWPHLRPEMLCKTAIPV